MARKQPRIVDEDAEMGEEDEIMKHLHATGEDGYPLNTETFEEATAREREAKLREVEKIQAERIEHVKLQQLELNKQQAIIEQQKKDLEEQKENNRRIQQELTQLGQQKQPLFQPREASLGIIPKPYHLEVDLNVDVALLPEIPLGRELDPAFRKTNADQSIRPVGVQHPFGEGPYPAPTGAFHRLTRGTAQTQIDEITNSPEKYMTIQFFGGGNDHKAKHEYVEKTVAENINGWGRGMVKVKKADTPNDGKPKGGPFDGPCFAILELEKENITLREFLSEHCVFSWEEGPHVFIKEVDTSETWVIMDITSTQELPSDQTSIRTTFQHIVSKLLDHEPFLAAVNRLAPYIQFKGYTERERAWEYVNTWYMVYIPTTKHDGSEEGVYQIRGQPLPIPPKSHRNLLETICVHPNRDFFMMGLTRYSTIGAAFNACVWCRSDHHPSYLCPYPVQPGWYGPTRAQTIQTLKDVSSRNPRNNTAGRGNSRPDNRGHRGRGSGGREDTVTYLGTRGSIRQDHAHATSSTTEIDMTTYATSTTDKPLADTLSTSQPTVNKPLPTSNTSAVTTFDTVEQ
ncbi:hypothetical protein PQX77_019382 [Marasmius sp. AFHP31]|nr:hypothetical protein PQX77_019382 [Marasmius sp. AFHP31]